MRQAFLVGVIISGIWAALAGGVNDGSVSFAFLVGSRALAGALLGTLAFLVAAQARHHGTVALIVALLLVILLSSLLLYPVAPPVVLT